ncbi:MAG: glycosyltransferase family 1 protein [Magnetococcales bacterium]|nr:glycosyltransferase family 1 protein [Magnetococcales bacterium]
MKIAVLMPRETFFNQFLAQCLKNALARQGAEVLEAPLCLEGVELAEFCRLSRPDAVLEMNRTRRQRPELPRDVLHAAWMVDFDAHALADFSDSELLYCFDRSWVAAFEDLRRRGLVSFERAAWLPPASCGETFRPMDGEIRWDFSFVGHLPGRWTAEEENRILLEEPPRGALRFGDLVPRLERRILDYNSGRFLLDAPHLPGVNLHLVQGILQELGYAGTLDLSDERLRYDLSVRVSRMAFRAELLSLALAVSRNAVFHGGGGWESWPEFRPYFRGVLEDQSRVAALFGASRIHLHNGVANHFRFFFCLGAGGGLVHLRQHLLDQDDDLAALGFFPGEHYLSATREDFAEQTADALRHPARLEAMGRRAAERVNREHTWDQRVEVILRQLRELRDG